MIDDLSLPIPELSFGFGALIIAIVMNYFGSHAPRAVFWSKVDTLYYPLGLIGVMFFFVAQASERTRSLMLYELADKRQHVEEVRRWRSLSSVQQRRAIALATSRAISNMPFPSREEIDLVCSKGATDEAPSSAWRLPGTPWELPRRIKATKENCPLLEKVLSPLTKLSSMIADDTVASETICTEIRNMATTISGVYHMRVLFLDIRDLITSPLIRPTELCSRLFDATEDRLKELEEEVTGIAKKVVSVGAGKYEYFSLLNFLYYWLWPFAIALAICLKIGKAASERNR